MRPKRTRKHRLAVAAIAAGLCATLGAQGAETPRLRQVVLPGLFHLDRDGVEAGDSLLGLDCELEALKNESKVKLSKHRGDLAVRVAFFRKSGGIRLGTGLQTRLRKGSASLTRAELGEALSFPDGLPGGTPVLEATFIGGSRARIDDVTLSCTLSTRSRERRLASTRETRSVARAFNFTDSGFDAEGSNISVTEFQTTLKARGLEETSGVVILSPELLANDFRDFEWLVGISLRKPNGASHPSKKAKGTAFGRLVAITPGGAIESPEVRTPVRSGAGEFSEDDLATLGDFLDGIANLDRVHVTTRFEGKGSARIASSLVTTFLSTGD